MLAGCFVGLGVALLVVRVGQPVILSAVRIVERLTDPILERLIWRRRSALAPTGYDPHARLTGDDRPQPPSLMPLAFLGPQLHHWIDNYGYEAVFALVALESVGVPLPGETALITAALYAATTHHLNIGIIIAAAALAAIIGDNIGFALGRWGGYRLLRRYGKYVRLNERRMKIGRYIFQQHGGKVVFIGRFVAVLRTYAAFLAGTNRMAWPRFLVFNAAGGITWALAVGLAYYYLGSAVAHVRGPLDIVIAILAAAVVIASLIYLHKTEDKYAARAEEAFPGELEEA